MIRLPEYHSRYAKYMCLLLAFLVAGMFYIKGEGKEGDGYFESAVDTFEYIFFFEDSMRKSWDSKSALRQESYNNDFDFYLKEMTDFHREEYLFNEVMYFLLVFMVIPYFLLGYLFTAVFHPIVIDPKRRVIYTVKRGKVYLFHKTTSDTASVAYNDGHGIIFEVDSNGPVAVRLKSIKEDRYRIFKIGVFPSTYSMGRWNMHQILCAFGLEENERYRKAYSVDRWKYLRWITTFSLYPSFLCKKVDDPYYLAQIDEYLAQQEKSSV
jgi:hypothetical protein